MAVDYQSNITPRLHRVDDPSKAYPTTREELLGYDVVICSDISRAAFTPEQIAWTVELVAKRGGGFAMVGGNTSFGSGGWDRTAWDGMIPIDMSGDGPGRGRSSSTGASGWSSPRAPRTIRSGGSSTIRPGTAPSSPGCPRSPAPT